jgi:hypothetical protein
MKSRRLPERSPCWAQIVSHSSSRADVAIERERHVTARPHAQRRGDGGPDVFPDEHVAIRDVENLVAGACYFPGPSDGAGQQVGIDRLGHARRAARKGQVNPCLAPQSGIDAKGRDHILALVSLLNASPVCYD